MKYYTLSHGHIKLVHYMHSGTFFNLHLSPSLIYVTSIRCHGSDVYLGMSLIEYDGSYLMH